MELYHRTRRVNLSSILSKGLLPRKPIEWRGLIPVRLRDVPIVWLKNNYCRGTRWFVDVEVDGLQQEKLVKLDLTDVDWWVYLGAISPSCVRIIKEVKE